MKDTNVKDLFVPAHELPASVDRNQLLQAYMNQEENRRLPNLNTVKFKKLESLEDCKYIIENWMNIPSAEKYRADFAHLKAELRRQAEGHLGFTARVQEHKEDVLKAVDAWDPMGADTTRQDLNDFMVHAMNSIDRVNTAIVRIAGLQNEHQRLLRKNLGGHNVSADEAAQHLIGELDGIRKDFPQGVYVVKKQGSPVISHILAITEDVVLEHTVQKEKFRVEFGKILLNLNCDGGWETLGNSMNFFASALTPKYPARRRADKRFPHPHIDRGMICLGQGNTPLQRATQGLQFQGAFQIVNSVMHTYGSSSPYYRLEEWEGEECKLCGVITKAENMTTCYYCGTEQPSKLCKKCAPKRTCELCGKIICSAHTGYRRITTLEWNGQTHTVCVKHKEELREKLSGGKKPEVVQEQVENESADKLIEEIRALMGIQEANRPEGLTRGRTYQGIYLDEADALRLNAEHEDQLQAALERAEQERLERDRQEAIQRALDEGANRGPAGWLD